MGDSELVLKDPCTVCLRKESTGVLIKMCDECFDDFELLVDAAVTQDEKDSLAKIAADANPFRNARRRNVSTEDVG